MKAILSYFEKDTKVKNAEIATVNFQDAYDAMMEGAAMLLDIVGEVTYVYTTKSGNKIRGRLDSP
ncbi:unnamed protein product [marine sediment metagenome]|uniref:Uncharacterized protein n=1 Tax=marine sediment metagenome TaxID=412755 RepID=X1B104_9ZZZZ